MKNTYLVLAIIGFTCPSILVLIESVETGNILLYAHPLVTIDGMFANRISSIFMIDLLFTVALFLLWSFFDARRIGVKNLGLVWFLTLALGLAGGFPLYLYLREKALSIDEITQDS